jgi:hypothetical protein
MHKICNGISTRDGSRSQIAIYKMYKKNPQLVNAFPWVKRVCMDSLVEVANFYCADINVQEHDKSTRDDFVEGVDVYRKGIEPYLHYCFTDTWYVVKVAQVLHPIYARKTHIINRGARLLQSEYLMPVMDNWHEWVNGCVKEFNKTKKHISNLLGNKGLESDNPYLQALCEGKNGLRRWSSGERKGMPRWVNKATWNPTEGWDITLKSIAAPYILGVTYRGFPLYYDPVKKWGYLDDQGNYTLIKEALGSNVGSPFKKEFGALWDDGVFQTDNAPVSLEILELTKSINYWDKIAKFCRNVAVVNVGGTRYLKPQLLHDGTITGRTTAGILQNLANYKLAEGEDAAFYNEVKQLDKPYGVVQGRKPKSIGYALKNMIKANDKHIIISADIDSQEATIAASLADTLYGELGSCPMSYIAYTGNKADKTDPHNDLKRRLMEIAGISLSRDVAKRLNFAMQYLAGVTGLSQQLGKDDAFPLETEERRREIAEQALIVKRGVRGKNKRFEGGTDSNYHNALNDYMAETPLKTLFLDREITEGFNPRYYEDKPNSMGVRSSRFLNSCRNYPIQGTGRDQLDYIIFLVNQIREELGLKVWFLFSNHDELVLEAEKSYDNVSKIVEALQVIHCSMWLAFFEKMGFKGMPTNKVFLSGINLDKHWRKEAYPLHYAAPLPLIVEKSKTLCKETYTDWLNLWEL